MKINKINMLMLLCDARQYHFNHNINRLQKSYKRKKEKEENERLIIYHKNMIDKIDIMISHIENGEQIEIIED